MSLRMRACILSVSGETLSVEEAALLADMQPWGVILMGRSCASRDQVRGLVDRIWDALGRACLIFIDQEGGRVARLKSPEWPRFPAAGLYSKLYTHDPEAGREAVWLGHRLIANELSLLGIHANCAPVLDRYIEGAHEIVGDRAFGQSASQIAELGRVALEGMRDGGVAGVIKHVPGHGRALVDSHETLPKITAGDNELSEDFACFAALVDAPMAMTAHIAFEAYDRDHPVTLSKTVISDVIRNRIGFDGLLMSDDLGMKALGGSLTERAQGAIAAGCDIALHCSGFVKDPAMIHAEMRSVAEVVPLLEGAALARAKHAENFATLSRPFDAAAGFARLSELFAPLEAVA